MRRLCLCDLELSKINNAEYSFELCLKIWYNLTYRHYFIFGIIQIYCNVCFLLFHRSTPPFLLSSPDFRNSLLHLISHRNKDTAKIQHIRFGFEFLFLPSALFVKGNHFVFLIQPADIFPFSFFHRSSQLSRQVNIFSQTLSS